MDNSFKNNFFDIFEQKKVETAPTVDLANAYCQKCFNKSITSFRISSDESITLCLNSACSPKSSLTSRIGYDTNNNETGPSSGKRMKYSAEIEGFDSRELKNFFEAKIDTVSYCQDLSTILTSITKPVVELSKTINTSEIQLENLSSQLLPELTTTSPTDYQFNDTSSIYIDPKLCLGLSGNTTLDIDQNNQTLAYQNPTDNDAPLDDINFDADLLSFLDTDTDLWTDQDPINNNSLYPMIQGPINNNNSYPMINDPIANNMDVDQTDLLSQLLGLDTKIPEECVNVNADEKITDMTIPIEDKKSPQVISDVKTPSGSRIKISKIKKKKEDKLVVIQTEEALLNKTDNSNSSSKYDSVGENENSSDRLLPWEVKSNGKKRKAVNFHNHLNEMSKANSQNKMSPRGALNVPVNVSRADLSSRSKSSPSKSSGTSLKMALSSKSDFKEEISNLFNTSNLITNSGNSTGGRGVKDLVLNILKKKTNV